MIKLIGSIKGPIKDKMFMDDMKPMDIARIVEKGTYENCIIMRTQSMQKIEIMNLSIPDPGSCFIPSSGYNRIEIELLPPGTVISFEVI